ncbi:Interleukin-27 subunit beta [Liparis tanakae]|uniref:Interleukin-27 subunit beta n=1 Tax=Liparis tanakae TaxID=230148 RepID=A0A4Z2FI77_9TELE|nr:Interleukin-27 subunit beta [Liparis tanakae]
MLEDIVKPDPPVEVRVSPPGTSGLLVEWSPPPTWTNLDIFPLKYQIRCRWEIHGSQKSATLGPFESTRVELKGLASGRTYRFQVCAQDLLGLKEGGLGRCAWNLSGLYVPGPGAHEEEEEEEEGEKEEEWGLPVRFWIEKEGWRRRYTSGSVLPYLAGPGLRA